MQEIPAFEQGIDLAGELISGASNCEAPGDWKSYEILIFIFAVAG